MTSSESKVIRFDYGAKYENDPDGLRKAIDGFYDAVIENEEAASTTTTTVANDDPSQEM